MCNCSACTSKKNDPFKRGRPCERCSISGNEKYEGQSGFEKLISKSNIHLLLRFDTRSKCSCASPVASTGDTLCSKCFGTGKPLLSIDKIQCYFSNSTISNRNLGNEGYNNQVAYSCYMLRNINPLDLDYVLEVGWDTSLKNTKNSGNVVSIYNIHLIKYREFVGLSGITYINAHTVLSNSRLKDFENILLFGQDLPKYKNLTI